MAYYGNNYQPQYSPNPYPQQNPGYAQPGYVQPGYQQQMPPVQPNQPNQIQTSQMQLDNNGGINTGLPGVLGSAK